MRTRSPRSHQHQHQRGAILIMTAAFIVAAVALLALAVDTGRLYAAQQKLQSTANLAALDAARAALGCQGQVPNPSAVALSAARASVSRNYANRAARQQPTVVAPVALGAATDRDGDSIRVFEANDSLAADPPDIDGDGQPDDVTTSAVQVVLQDQFKPILNIVPGTTNLTARAAAENAPRATISVGSTLLDLQPSILGALLGNPGVSVLGPAGAANVDITLGALSQSLGVATPEGLLTASTPLARTVSAIDDAAGGALQGLDQAIGGDLGDTGVTVGDVLRIAGPITPDLQINAGALTGALVLAAQSNRKQAISLPLSQAVNVPAIGNLAGLDATLRVLQPPVIDMGRPGSVNGTPRTRATSAQLLLNLQASVGIPPLANVTLPLYVRGAFASARLDNITCASAKQHFNEVTVSAAADSGALGIGEYENLDSENPQLDAGASVSVTLAGLPVTVPVSGQASLGEAPLAPLEPPYRSPADADDGNVREIRAGLEPGRALVDLAGSLQIGPLGLGVLGGPVTTVLNGLGLDPTFNALLQNLGVELGNAQVRLLGVDAHQPQLFAD